MNKDLTFDVNGSGSPYIFFRRCKAKDASWLWRLGIHKIPNLRYPRVNDENVSFSAGNKVPLRGAFNRTKCKSHTSQIHTQFFLEFASVVIRNKDNFASIQTQRQVYTKTYRCSRGSAATRHQIFERRTVLVCTRIDICVANRTNGNVKEASCISKGLRLPLGWA